MNLVRTFGRFFDPPDNGKYLCKCLLMFRAIKLAGNIKWRKERLLRRFVINTVFDQEPGIFAILRWIPGYTMTQ